MRLGACKPQAPSWSSPLPYPRLRAWAHRRTLPSSSREDAVVPIAGF